MSWKRAILLGVSLQVQLLAACSGTSHSDESQSADTLMGGASANDVKKDTRKDTAGAGTHAGQAGAGPGRTHEDAGVEQEDDKDAGAKAPQGQAGAPSTDDKQHGKGRQEAGAGGSEAHGKSAPGHAGSHAQGPKAGHGA